MVVALFLLLTSFEVVLKLLDLHLEFVQSAGTHVGVHELELFAKVALVAVLRLGILVLLEETLDFVLLLLGVVLVVHECVFDFFVGVLVLLVLRVFVEAVRDLVAVGALELLALALFGVDLLT